MQRTDIEWTDLSANPLKYRRPDGSTAWACVKVSPGCANCYSEAIGNRFGRAETFNVANTSKLTPFMDPKELREMVNRQTCQSLQVDGSRCFVGDMTDLFGEWVPFELLDQLFAVMALRPQVTFQILTKRPERAAEYLQRLQGAADQHAPQTKDGRFSPTDVLRIRWMNANRLGGPASGWHCGGGGVIQAETPWPLPNVWLGTSVENQAAADERREHLRNCPAAIRFVSYEPALQPVNWSGWEFVDQIISGGESGPNARPSHPACHRGARDFCTSHGIAYFFKQWGEWYGADIVDSPEFSGGRMFEAPGFGRSAAMIRERSPKAFQSGEYRPMQPGDKTSHYRMLDLNTVAVKAGKKAAGRLLDGREWNQFPEVVVEDAISDGRPVP